MKSAAPYLNPKPDWLKIRPPGGENYLKLKGLIKSLALNTVCEEARCPNVAECWGTGTATLMLMGDTCTRGCRFCHVKSGNPGGLLDPREPEKIASVLSRLKLKYVVLTSVDRDDISDGGADHFARTVEAIRRVCPETLVEVLIPDFQGNTDALDRILLSQPDVIAHNIETVERLTSKVRDKRCGYHQSLRVLNYVKTVSAKTYTKSSVMLGLGETFDEVDKCMDDLYRAGVEIVTLGQYLRPSNWHLPVEKYLTPEEFKWFEIRGLEKGFLSVPSGPLVRSSYRAAEKFLESRIREERRSHHG